MQLAALALQGSTDIPGSHRYIVDYLADEVLRQQPEEVRAFLPQTAILDRLCSPYAAPCATPLPAGETVRR